MKKHILLAGLMLLLFSCEKEKQKGVPLLDANDFTTIIDEKSVSLYTLESESGIYMQITNFGGRIVALWTPDRKGNYENIVLGYENIDRYINNEDQTLHDDSKSLDQVVWEVDKICKDEIKFSYLPYEITYTLTPNNELKIVYEATTDSPTVINLLHYELFNLKGNGIIADYTTTATENPGETYAQTCIYKFSTK